MGQHCCVTFYAPRFVLDSISCTNKPVCIIVDKKYNREFADRCRMRFGYAPAINLVTFDDKFVYHMCLSCIARLNKLG